MAKLWRKSGCLLDSPQDIEEDYGHVLAQDAERVPEVQKGLHSRAYRGSLLFESEYRIRHYLAEVDK